MFGSPQIVARYDSKYSGPIEVVKGLGVLYIRTGDIFQSGDLVTGIWKDVLKTVAQKNRSWLVLGVAGGSVIKFISRKYTPASIVGVEIDPIMIDVGKHYFGLSKIKNFTLLHINADYYVSHLNSSFDFILVDLLFNDTPPDFLTSNAFLTQLRQSGKIVLFNRLYHTNLLRINADAYVKKLKTVFANVLPVRTHQNLVLVCS